MLLCLQKQHFKIRNEIDTAKGNDFKDTFLHCVLQENFRILFYEQINPRVYYFLIFKNFAGCPTYILHLGILLFTRLIAPMTHPSSNLTPGNKTL